MEKEKPAIIVHLESDSDDDDELTLSELFHRDNLSRHLSSSQHIATPVHGVQGEATKEDGVDTKNRREHISPHSPSPCSSDTLPSSMTSKRRDRGYCGSRGKMNNGTFDDHLEKIWTSVSEDKKSSFALLDSMCFLFYKMGRRWGLDAIKHKDIFSKKYVLVPILCCESACSEARTRCIVLLDSLDMGVQEIEPDLRKFVFDIFEAVGRPEIKDVIYQIPLLAPKVPQQRNNVDCGRFVLYFIKNFMDAAPENFSLSNGYPYFMRPNWFTADMFEDFCNKLDKESLSDPDSASDPPGGRAVRRSQRIRNKRTQQSPPPSPPSPFKTANQTYYLQKSSGEEFEVFLID